ncbi:uncharacterized protein F5Z01DRAFT_634982 [Emericellopsis atlantica]|uniref:Uncharacterized protein n=1 Tax=Emericellopsis atlantica TaxID=2614577 RepID=A0A9P8CQK1_9HYPO|nr:uncharacterized protein F5Z01DRAFT_634982 [Emericellopsis atlantica]KAG9256019.1 hypothetical protein F5Z01DRAFT_634982 [Emericellopsis atlantica]
MAALCQADFKVNFSATVAHPATLMPKSPMTRLPTRTSAPSRLPSSRSRMTTSACVAHSTVDFPFDFFESMVEPMCLMVWTFDRRPAQAKPGLIQWMHNTVHQTLKKPQQKIKEHTLFQVHVSEGKGFFVKKLPTHLFYSVLTTVPDVVLRQPFTIGCLRFPLLPQQAQARESHLQRELRLCWGETGDEFWIDLLLRHGVSLALKNIAWLGIIGKRARRLLNQHASGDEHLPWIGEHCSGMVRQEREHEACQGWNYTCLNYSGHTFDPHTAANANRRYLRTLFLYF